MLQTRIAGLGKLALTLITVLFCSRLQAMAAETEEAKSSSARGSAAAGPQLGVNARLGGLNLFPDDNPWNTSIADLPVADLSADYLAAIGLDAPLHPDFGSSADGLSPGIPYVVVSGNQPRSPVDFEYADESDREPYPIPANPPIEAGGDRHLLILDRDRRRLYELFALERVGDRWKAGSGAIFNLDSNRLRPAGFTSADAAGLPILPGLVRYEEVAERGAIEHALRFTAKKTQKAYISPARHAASRSRDPQLPPMGLRVRLKASYDISGHPKSVQTILTALKKYGMILADNGGNWFITGAPDQRWNDDELASLKRVKGSDLEAVSTGNVVRQ